MTGDIGEAIGAICVLALGGIIFIRLGAALNRPMPISFEFWGIIFLLGAALAIILLVYGIFNTIMN